MSRKTEIQEQIQKPMEEKKIENIEDLPGVGPATAEKLRESGYDTLLSLSVASPGELTEAGGFTEQTARKVIKAARDTMHMDFESAEDLLEKRKNILKISTGSKAVDNLLGGGFESGSITEMFGEFGSSKTQVAHQLAVNVQLPKEQGGAEGVCVYIDSEGAFRPERIQQMALAKGLDPIKVLKNIKVARAFNSDHQMLLAEKAGDLIKKDNLNVKLIVVDSLMSHFRADFSGRGQLADRQQKLNKHMHSLMKLATMYNLVIYVTNQVMSKPDTFFGDPTAAIGGHIVGHNCLRADSLLQLGDGAIKPIADCYDNKDVICIKFDDGMLIGKENFLNFYINVDTKNIYSIDAGYKIECSSEHRFFKLNESCIIEEATAKDLKIGDHIACAKRINVNGKEKTLPEVKIEKIFKLTKEGKQLVYKSLKETAITRKEFCKEIKCKPRQLRRILNKDYPTTEDNLLLIKNNLGINCQIALQVTTNKHKDIVMPKYFTPEICQILGYFLGDGNFEQRSLRFRDARLDVLQYYNNIFKQEFNIEGNITKINKKNCYNLNINNTSIRELFCKINNNLMEYISKLPNKQISYFIRGFADAEGYVSKKEPKLSISQKDELLLKYIQMLLLRLGVRSTLNKANARKQVLYNLFFSGRDVLRFGEAIGLTANDKKTILKKWMERCKRAKFTRELIPINRIYLWNLLLEAGIKPSSVMKSRPKSYKYITLNNLNKVVECLDGMQNLKPELLQKLDNIRNLINADIEWRKIRCIEQHKNNEPLYDIEVPGAGNYIANGFVVHNSQTRIYLRKGKKGTRVAKLIDSPHLPDGEAIFIVEESGIKDI